MRPFVQIKAQQNIEPVSYHVAYSPTKPMKTSHTTTVRTIALVVALGLAGAANIYAQDDAIDRRFRFGVKGGVNLSNLYNTGTGVSDNNVKPSFNVGVLVRTPLAAIFGFQIEALYTVKGSKLGYNTSSTATDKSSGTFNLGYIQVPAMIRFQPIDVFSIHAGAYASYLTNVSIAKGQFATNTNVTPEKVDYQNTDNYNTLDWGLLGGAELNLKYVDIGLRYDLGLRQVGRNNNAFFGNGRNSSGSLYVAFVY